MHLRLYILLLACTGLAGCGQNQSNVEKGNAEQELYIGIGTEPEGLDPHIVTGVTEHYILLSLFEGLTTVHPETLAIEPGVAQSWDISEDGLRYTFKLDPEARWSNGDPLTAEAFLFAYERILTPAMGAPYAYMLYCIRGVKRLIKANSLTSRSRAEFARTVYPHYRPGSPHPLLTQPADSLGMVLT